VKAVLRGKFIPINAYKKKSQRYFPMKNLTRYLKVLEKQEQANYKISIRKNIINSRVGIQELEIKRII
jgi:hypothetical protein